MKKILLAATAYLVCLSASAGVYATCGPTQVQEYDDGRTCKFWKIYAWHDNGTSGDHSDDILLGSGVAWEDGCPLNGVNPGSTGTLDDNQNYAAYIINEIEDGYSVIVVPIGEGYAIAKGIIIKDEENSKRELRQTSSTTTLMYDASRFELNIDTESSGNIYVYSIAGNLMTSGEVAEGVTRTIDVSSWNAGTYVVVVVDQYNSTVISSDKVLIAK